MFSLFHLFSPLRSIDFGLCAGSYSTFRNERSRDAKLSLLTVRKTEQSCGGKYGYSVAVKMYNAAKTADRRHRQVTSDCASWYAH
jgi:hypothetical protein